MVVFCICQYHIFWCLQGAIPLKFLWAHKPVLLFKKQKTIMCQHWEAILEDFRQCVMEIVSPAIPEWHFVKVPYNRFCLKCIFRMISLSCEMVPSTVVCFECVLMMSSNYDVSWYHQLYHGVISLCVSWCHQFRCILMSSVYVYLGVNHVDVESDNVTSGSNIQLNTINSLYTRLTWHIALLLVQMILLRECLWSCHTCYRDE